MTSDSSETSEHRSILVMRTVRQLNPVQVLCTLGSKRGDFLGNRLSDGHSFQREPLGAFYTFAGISQCIPYIDEQRLIRS